MAEEIVGGEMPEGDAPADAGSELEMLRVALKRANREAAERRKKLEELEAGEAKRREAEMSEAERLKAQAAAAEQRLQVMEKALSESRIRQAVTVAASGLAFVDADDAYRLADLSGVTIDEAGTVSGVDGALKALAKAKPHLLRQAGGAAATNINATSSGRQTRISPDELVQRKRASGDYVPI